jgi:copper chaperone NosL
MTLRVWLPILFWIAAGCSGGPRPIEYGKEACGFCRMSMADNRFGTEVRTEKGRVLVFDDIECMAGYSIAAAAPLAGRWVTDFRRPGELLPATEAFYLRSPKLHSPMGMNFAAFATRKAVEDAAAEFGGQALTWNEVVELVRASSFGRVKAMP